MDRSLDHYMLIFDEVIDETKCNEIVNVLENVDWHTHTFYNNKTGEMLSHEHELDSFGGHTVFNDLLMQKVWGCISQYVDYFNFPWFQGWAGHSNIKYNRYRPETMMTEHCDHIHSLFDGQKKGVPYLTVIGCLNDTYSGGELVFFQDKVVKLKKGSIIIFPSNFLYPHKVNFVREGIRYSFVSWVY